MRKEAFLQAMTPENERRKLFVSVLECKVRKRVFLRDFILK
eukprot:COSAG06_NODE_4846_length_3911_cov_2.296957_6_plen_41_part_00